MGRCVAVGCLYWWHPVVWWVRSRIAAEAEDCCDAWVTWFNPKNRRAYAEILLTARHHFI
ncbi:MAG: M56 family metallopeptidase [Phycisphaerae bacterium]